jgi:hypothetical protein
MHQHMAHVLGELLRHALNWGLHNVQAVCKHGVQCLLFLLGIVLPAASRLLTASACMQIGLMLTEKRL